MSGISGMKVYEVICSIVESSDWYLGLAPDDQWMARQVLYSMDPNSWRDAVGGG